MPLRDHIVAVVLGVKDCAAFGGASLSECAQTFLPPAGLGKQLDQDREERFPGSARRYHMLHLVYDIQGIYAAWYSEAQPLDRVHQ